jgi:dienelactone hydrolase
VAALKLLQSHTSVSGNDISAIGYCFGGGIVLEMARRGLDLDLVASFHGSLGSSAPAESGEVKARVLVYNGVADPFVTAEQIYVFEQEMKRAGVDYAITHYPNAKHAFTNPAADELGKRFDLPLEYNRSADDQSWAALMRNLQQVYGNN